VIRTARARKRTGHRQTAMNAARRPGQKGDSPQEEGVAAGRPPRGAAPVIENKGRAILAGIPISSSTGRSSPRVRSFVILGGVSYSAAPGQRNIPRGSRADHQNVTGNIPGASADVVRPHRGTPIPTARSSHGRRKHDDMSSNPKRDGRFSIRGSPSSRHPKSRHFRGRLGQVAKPRGDRPGPRLPEERAGISA